MINMTLRIIHGTWFISNHYSEPYGKFFVESLPQIQTFCALILSFLLQILSQLVFFNGFMPIFVKIIFHGIVGVLSGIIVLAVTLRYEKEIVNSVLLQVPVTKRVLNYIETRWMKKTN